jgi:hypothetical protein
MTSLSHEQAREFIQQGHLAEGDRLALREHLTTCDECRAYAAVHVHLWRQLPLRASRVTPTSAQRAAVLAAAAGRRAAPRLWRPLSAAGSMAVVLFLALGFWLVLRAASPVASQPTLPAPLATLLAPFLPQPTPAATEPVPTSDPRGRHVIDTVPAPSLAGNVIGEPLEQQVAVYLPPSYDGSDRRYPVVYALIPGETTNNRMEMLESYIRSGMNLTLRNDGAREMIVVALNNVNSLNLPNLFVNSPITGDWESYLATDLVSYIDTHYRTLPDADSRGLLGDSYHGIDALTIATRHSETFGAVYLQRPLIFAPGDLEENMMVSAVARSGTIDFLDELSALSPEASLVRIKERFDVEPSHLPVLQFVIPYGMAYAPTAETAVPFFEYPFVDPDGPADPEIWRKWESGFGNIPEKLQTYRDALLTLKIGVSSNDGSTYLSEQLTIADISHTFTKSETSPLEELGIEVFPFFSEVLDFE